MKTSSIMVDLDESEADQALALAAKLKEVVGGFRVGLKLYMATGPSIVRRIRKKGLPVLLDLNLFDAPNTVSRAVTAAARLGVGMMTVHASGDLAMMEAAEQAARIVGMELGASPLILGVTVLTSFDDDALHRIGIPSTTARQSARLTRLAMKAQLRGLVCSPLEVAVVRALVPREVQLVVPVPGNRSTRSRRPSQRLIGKLKRAMNDGADWLVIGRPITRASDPRRAAEAILTSLT